MNSAVRWVTLIGLVFLIAGTIFWFWLGNAFADNKGLQNSVDTLVLARAAAKKCEQNGQPIPAAETEEFVVLRLTSHAALQEWFKLEELRLRAEAKLEGKDVSGLRVSYPAPVTTEKLDKIGCEANAEDYVQQSILTADVLRQEFSLTDDVLRASAANLYRWALDDLLRSHATHKQCLVVDGERHHLVESYLNDFEQYADEAFRDDVAKIRQRFAFRESALERRYQFQRSVQSSLGGQPMAPGGDACERRLVAFDAVMKRVERNLTNMPREWTVDVEVGEGIRR
ncbi:MAG: hypothetical protein P1U69_17580 [Parvibaculaceae bacterium]|nr:hypothetical protein [Parvibaculaceae bacterium]HBM88992.1 hypothetical protein [Rhodobiaceae bacterium]